MKRIAITSVGSLVGQNILDCLEGRRAGIEIVGINSTAEAAGNFRCDRAYLAPPTASTDEYLERLASIFLDERPDLILPGRDDDVLALAQLKEARPQLNPSLPVGPHRLTLVLDDKWASHGLARAHGLPYVDSALTEDLPAVERLLAVYGYPLIAKPRVGNGSRGVRIVFDEMQRAAVARLPGYLLQAYLEPEAELMGWRDLARDGVPLFHAPMLQQIACPAVMAAQTQPPGGDPFLARRDRAADMAAVERLRAVWGYPLIAKPRIGNGSRGVRGAVCTVWPLHRRNRGTDAPGLRRGRASGRGLCRERAAAVAVGRQPRHRHQVLVRLPASSATSNGWRRKDSGSAMRRADAPISEIRPPSGRQGSGAEPSAPSSRRAGRKKHAVLPQ